MEALERVVFLHWRLTGAHARIPWIGDLVLPSLPQEAVIESNLRLDILTTDRQKGDPYIIEAGIQELLEKQARGRKR